MWYYDLKKTMPQGKGGQYELRLWTLDWTANLILGSKINSDLDSKLRKTLCIMTDSWLIPYESHSVRSVAEPETFILTLLHDRHCMHRQVYS